MKKGFTLVELLATIVVLIIISLITVPVISGVIEKVRKSAVKDSVYGLFDATDFFYATNNNESIGDGLVFTCDGIKCQTEKGSVLQFKGEVPKSGQIILRNGHDIEAYYIRLGKYCVLGNKETLDIQKDCTKLDISRPNLTVEKITQTTKSVVVRVATSDIESGIDEIKYEINGRTYTDKYDSSIVNIEKTFDGLSAGRTYNLKVQVTNGNGLTQDKTIEVSTSPITLTLKFNKTPSEAVNGYYKELEAYMEYGDETLTGYYIKTTRSGKSDVNAIKSCGSNTTPGECESITGTNNLDEDVWYYFESEPKITYDTTSTSTGTLYVRVTNGTSVVNASATIPKVDKKGPNVTLGTGNVTSKSVSIPITSSDNESGLDTVTCKYSTTDGSYTTNATTVSTSNCTISNVSHDVTYYYKVCIKDNMGNETCKTGSSKTDALTVTPKSTSTPSEAQNGYYKEQVWSLDTTGTPTGYYIKSTRVATSSVSLTKSCGTNTNPETCNTITGTTSMTANTWYYAEEKPTVTYNTTATTTATLYARITDGQNTTANASATVSKIDKKGPNVTLGTGNVTSKSVSIPITSSDDESGLDTATCKYSTTSGSYTTNATTVSTSNCTISNITHNTTYYYQVCVKDKMGNEICKTGNSKTTELKVTLTSTNTPSTPTDGYYKTQVWSLTTTGNPNGYYVKSTRAATTNVNMTKSCGTGTNPGTCSNITGTKNIAADTWYYTTSKPSITYDETATTTATLYVRITDGKNTTANAIATVSKIKKEITAAEVGITVDGHSEIENVEQALDDLYEKLS